MREQEQKIAILATFTSEPVENPLQFWIQKLKMSAKIEFAPYNQVFQQLLDSASLINRNKNGINIILVRFEDWVRYINQLSSEPDFSEKKYLLDDRSRYTLPNQLEIAHLNQYETEYVYQEIFVDQCYLRHGITLEDGDCVIDIGANIGLFTLFVQQHYKNTTIYAFEPSPPVFELLDINATLYGSNVKVFNCGLSNETKEEVFTFYEKSSVFSGFNANIYEDEEAIKSVVRNVLRENNTVEADDLDEFVGELMVGRLESKSFVCQLRTLSEIIRKNDIQHIDLLKVDAEKSELDILRGIEADDWVKIKQIVIEVHDKKGDLLKEIVALLQEKGFELAIDEEKLLQDSGLYNIFAKRPLNGEKFLKQKASTTEKQEKIRESVIDFTLALKSSAERSSIPYLICICPPSLDIVANAEQMAFHKQMEELMASEIDSANNIYLVTTSELFDLYFVSTYYDPIGDELGHIPFTPQFFTALGTLIARKIYALQAPPYKVIVLDCDQTLWKGVCGEDGFLGIEIDPPRQALQKFMVAQYNMGMLICLSSKNNEEDVVEVFAHRPEMLLKREHVVSWRINWESKSKNIRSLANELELGLDSFIFIDDNPIECAEVQANYPQVLTIQLPQEPNNIPLFLKHIWAFDRLKVTKEDQKRTVLYQQNIQRQYLRDQSPSLEDFLLNLGLEIQISRATQSQLTRVSQLTQRTNQFNLTTIRRSEGEIQTLCQSGFECFVVNVQDRFGDYGLVGVMISQTNIEAIELDTFLLSCRVLGRGVEHKMLAQLGEIAIARGLDRVDVMYIPTQKNEPILKFLNSFGAKFKQPSVDGFNFKFPADFVASLTYKPDVAELILASDQPEEAVVLGAANASSTLQTWKDSKLLSHIATELYDVEQIHRVIVSSIHRPRPELKNAFVAPRTPIEEKLAAIWTQNLGLDRVGVNDNFFELGGQSLRATQVVSRIRDVFQVELPISYIFELRTIAKLSEAIERARNSHSKPQAQSIVSVSRKRHQMKRSLTGSLFHIKKETQKKGDDVNTSSRINPSKR